MTDKNVAQIVRKVTSHLYTAFRFSKIWKQSKSTGNYKSILGSMKFNVEKPLSTSTSSHIALLFSLCTHTVKKVLIGCLEVGYVNFISIVEDENTSFKQTLERNRFFGNLQSGDRVSVDESLAITDALIEKGLAVSVRGENDYTSETIDTVIQKGRQMAILHKTFPSELIDIASEIVFNCFFLVNFMEPLLLTDDETNLMNIKPEIEIFCEEIIEYVEEENDVSSKGSAEGTLSANLECGELKMEWEIQNSEKDEGENFIEEGSEIGESSNLDKDSEQ